MEIVGLHSSQPPPPKDWWSAIDNSRVQWNSNCRSYPCRLSTWIDVNFTFIINQRYGTRFHCDSPELFIFTTVHVPQLKYKNTNVFVRYWMLVLLYWTPISKHILFKSHCIVKILATIHRKLTISIFYFNKNTLQSKVYLPLSDRKSIICNSTLEWPWSSLLPWP